MLLVYRLRGLAFEREVLRLHAEATAAEQVRRSFLRLRDYANTPIQTIVFATELLRVRNPDLRPILDRLDHAAKRLMELSRALSAYDSTHKWSPGDESLDEGMMAEQPARAERRNRNRSVQRLHPHSAHSTD